MRVWLAQCLCPDRHAIMAAAKRLAHNDDPQALCRELRQTVEHAIEEGGINPWCSLCNARQDTWIYEAKPTPFRSMVAATPLLLQAEAEQIAASKLFGDMKRSD